MIRHITAEEIFRLAVRAVEMGTDEDFVEFSRTLRSWTDHFQDFISAFRDLHFIRTRLRILPLRRRTAMQVANSDRLYRHGTGAVASSQNVRERVVRYVSLDGQLR